MQLSIASNTTKRTNEIKKNICLKWHSENGWRDPFYNDNKNYDVDKDDELSTGLIVYSE